MTFPLFNLLPFAISGLLVASYRRKPAVYLVVAALLIAGLFAFHSVAGRVTTSYHGPFMAAGYETWSFPLAAATASLCVWLLRGTKASPTQLFLVALMVSFIFMQLGGWLT
jgi:hypothetical protein